MADHDKHGDDKGSHKPHKKHHPHMPHEHEHEEGWIVSFADNVLLMMGFFVILLAMNMGPKGKSDAEPQPAGASDSLIDFAIAVREAFNNPVSMDSTKPEDQALIRRLKDREVGERRIGPSGKDSKSQAVRRNTSVGEDGYVQFDANKTTLTESGRQTIEEIATKLAGARWVIEVRGHASRWESWGDERKARELSYQRAWAVGNELVRHGISWDQLRLAASGHSAPVVARAMSSAEAETNQRTEIIVLDEPIPEDPFSATPTKRRGAEDR
ncbi:MAG: OmpA family protein [Phycisphaerales bacterium]|nr:OmpA family protein [Phycisphaerales bacterium]